MPDLNDYHAFKSTSGGSGGGIDPGCLKTVVVIGVIVLFLVLLGKCAS